MIDRRQIKRAIHDQRLKERSSSRPDTRHWGPWEWRNHLVGHPDALPGLLRCCLNKLFSVQFFQKHTDLFGVVDHLMIRRHDEGVQILWWEKQLIKDQLGFADRYAIEVFPPTASIVDEANMFHLFILPADVVFPVLLKEGDER